MVIIRVSHVALSVVNIILLFAILLSVHFKESKTYFKVILLFNYFNDGTMFNKL